MFNKPMFLFAFLILISSASITAQAKDMSYAYIEANSIIDSKITLGGNGPSANGNGGGLAFSFLMGPIGYSEWMYEGHSLDSGADATEITARFGAHHRFTQFQYGKLDLYGGLSMDDANFEFKVGNTKVEALDDSGVGGYIGLKHSPNRHIEYGADLSVNNIEDVAIITRAYLQWNVTHAFAVNVGYRGADYALDGPDLDVDSFKVGAHITFGTP